MAAPEVGQAGMIGDVLGRLVTDLGPASLALLGCAGGNGLERVSPNVTSRVVAIDINPAYCMETERRFGRRFERLDVHAGDLLDPRIDFEPVDLVYAALVLEYVSPEALLLRSGRWLREAGRVATVIQLPAESVDAVTPTGFHTLRALSAVLRHVPPADVRRAAEQAGLTLERSERVHSTGGKTFEAQVFRRLEGRER